MTVAHQYNTLNNNKNRIPMLGLAQGPTSAWSFCLWSSKKLALKEHQHHATCAFHRPTWGMTGHRIVSSGWSWLYESTENATDMARISAAAGQVKHHRCSTTVYHSACTQSGSNLRQSVDDVQSYHQPLPIWLLSTATASWYDTVTDTRRNQNAGSCVHLAILAHNIVPYLLTPSCCCITISASE